MKAHNDGRGPYGAVYRSLWAQDDFRRLSFEAKAVFLYLRTCPLAGLLGVFPFHPDMAAADLSEPAERIVSALAELEAGRFVFRSPDAPSWLWVVSSFGSTPGVSLNNLNHVEGARRALASVPRALADAFRAFYFDADERSHPGSHPPSDPPWDPEPVSDASREPAEGIPSRMGWGITDDGRRTDLPGSAATPVAARREHSNQSAVVRGRDAESVEGRARGARRRVTAEELIG